jgi:hypothetical protein
MSNNTYNGWRNFETWQASQRLSEADTLGRLRADSWKRVDAEDVESLVHELLEEEDVEIENTYGDGLLSDIINGWLSSVDFHEIADHYNQDLEG